MKALVWILFLALVTNVVVNGDNQTEAIVNETATVTSTTDQLTTITTTTLSPTLASSPPSTTSLLSRDYEDIFTTASTTLRPPPPNIPTLLKQLKANSFLDLLMKTGLVDTLGEPGPFTVFVPTDSAFAQVDSKVLSQLQTDPALLKSFLRYHMISGRVLRNVLQQNIQIPTLQGKDVQANSYLDGKHILINGAPVKEFDQIALNGVIHTIDKILYPLPIGDTIETLKSYQGYKFEKLLNAIRQSLLEYTINRTGLTLLAPTDEAFAKLPDGTYEKLLQNPNILRGVLLKHVATSVIFSDILPYLPNLQTLSGEDLAVKITSDSQPEKREIFIENASVIEADIPTTNGAIFIIDTVFNI